MREDLKWIDRWVWEWSRWMSQDHATIRRMCGYPGKSAGFLSGGSSSEDTFELMVEQADQNTVRVIDTCIRQLDGQHYAALCNKYLNDLWGHRGDPVRILEEALDLVAIMARRKGVE